MHWMNMKLGNKKWMRLDGKKSFPSAHQKNMRMLTIRFSQILLSPVKYHRTANEFEIVLNILWKLILCSISETFSISVFAVQFNERQEKVYEEKFFLNSESF